MAEEEKQKEIRCRVISGTCKGESRGGIVYLNETQVHNFRDIVEPYPESQEEADKKAIAERRRAAEAAQKKEADKESTHKAAESSKKAASE